MEIVQFSACFHSSACITKGLKDGICSATCYKNESVTKWTIFPHTSTAGYIMFYIIQGTLCKEMDFLTCYLHKSALYSWGPLFIAVVPLQAAMAVLEWTPTQREFRWGRVKGQLINTQEWWFVLGGLLRVKRAEDAPSSGWGTAWPVCYYWGLLESSWQREREKKREAMFWQQDYHFTGCTSHSIGNNVPAGMKHNHASARIRTRLHLKNFLSTLQILKLLIRLMMWLLYYNISCNSFCSIFLKTA